MKYLLKQWTYDDVSFYAFESDKTTEQLNKELPKKIGRYDETQEFEFYGFVLDNHWIWNYKVYELNEFWDKYTLKEHDKRMDLLKEKYSNEI